jgi:beta-glucosidase
VQVFAPVTVSAEVVIRRLLLLSLLVAATLPLLAVGGGSAAANPCGDPSVRPWCNTKLTPDRRADLLLNALTQDEKLTLLAGVASADHTGQTAAIPRVGLRSVFLTDDSKGVKQGSATALPIPLAVAATFDPREASLAGTVIGSEARAKGNDVLLGPTVNIMRTPLGGRTFEAFGEDPFLVAHTAVPWIEGVQHQGVMAEVKHFCCNNQEGLLGAYCEKNYCSSNLDERTLREIYLPGFEAAIEDAHAATVMCAYNRVNDDWACEHEHLLMDILKGEWRFPGMVVSDWQAQHWTPLALKNGLDLEMPTAQDYSPQLVQAAIDSGLVTQAQVDEHVHRFLRTLFAYGFFDRPAYANDDSQIDVSGHAQIAQRMEENAIVLLQNRGSILPLDPKRVHSIALIGPQADRFENGGGADDIVPFTYTTPLQAITRRAGPNVTVTYDDGSDATKAAADASAADVAIVFASDTEGEYMDKFCTSVDCTNQGRTGTQDNLVSTVAAANPNTIVVLETGDPISTPWRDSVEAILEAWYPGEEAGPALAHVLFGDVDPGGRLPVTFPPSETQYPTAGDPRAYPGVGGEIFYDEGVFVGYRWYDENHVAPAFPFGAGLSYTSFRYSRLRVQARGDAVTVTAQVTNTGKRTGFAVPQLYVGMPSPSPTVLQPPLQLKGYDKLSLAPGRTRTVTFALDDRSFSYWDTGSNGWRVAPGCYRILVGSSSGDLPLRSAVSRAGGVCSLR